MNYVPRNITFLLTKERLIAILKLNHVVKSCFGFTSDLLYVNINKLEAEAKFS